MVDVIIIGIVLAYCVYVLYKEYKKKQQEKCTGVCTGCASASCSVDYEKMFSDIRKNEFQKQE